MVELLLTVALIGCAAYLLVTYVPMLAPFKAVITVLAAIFCLLILVRAFGFDMPVPRWG